MNQQKQRAQIDDSWLTQRAPFPAPRSSATQHNDDFVNRLLAHHWRLLIVLSVLSTILMGGALIEKGRSDALYQREHTTK